MSDITLKNTGPGRRYLPGYGVIEPGDLVTVTAEEAKRFADDTLLVHRERVLVEKTDDEEGGEGGEQQSGAELAALTAKYAGDGELVTRDRAEEICAAEGVTAHDFQAALKAGEIKGAHKTGESVTSPWAIPVAGLCQWIAELPATENE